MSLLFTCSNSFSVSVYAKLDISCPNWYLKDTVFVCASLTLIVTHSPVGYGHVSVFVCFWKMANNLCGVEGHLAKLRSGWCRRWEERGRAGRLTTYWWNEKSLAQPDNLPPPHLVMNSIQHCSSSYWHTWLYTLWGCTVINILKISLETWHLCW